MNSNLIQVLRYKLQKRVRRLNSIDNSHYFHYHFALIQFWNFLQSQTVFKGILDDIENRYYKSIEDAEKILKASREIILFDNEIEEAAAAYFVIKKCIQDDNDRIEFSIGSMIFGRHDNENALSNFHENIVEPFYEFIDEKIDDEKLLLSLLIRYKRRTEWFNREILYSKWKEETTKGEKILALDLYSFLFDQGIEFSIEPASISGEADLVSIQTDEEPLIADAKIFNPDKSKNKSYIINGINQLYTYTLDYNETFGYLLVYNTSQTDLLLNFQRNEQSIPCISINNKTIFVLMIDIYPHEQSASKRGKLKAIELNENEIIEKINLMP
nr:hypothetical protein [uncultured Draconibacterium sp.]